MPSFKTFDFIDTPSKTLIKCKKKGCSAPQADYLTEEGKNLYSKTGYISPINDCNSDVTLTCKTCGNTEMVEGILGIHLS